MPNRTSKFEFAFWFNSFFAFVAVLVGRAQSQPVWFPMNGKSYFVLGANYPWYNGFRGLDLGPYLGTKTIATVAYATPKKGKRADVEGWESGHDLQRPSIPIRTGTTGFNADGIKAQLQDAHSVGIHALRWFFGDDGRSFIIFDGHGNCTGIDKAALQNVDRALALAQSNHVYIVPVLFDFRFISGDHWLRYEDGSSGLGQGHADAIRDSAKRKLLIENFIKPLVERCAGSSAILYWEIMNEAGNVVQGTDPVTGFTMDGPGKASHPNVSVVEMQTFMNEVYAAIKSVDQAHLVMPSGLGKPWQLPLVVGRVKADLFGAHYKDDGDTDYGRVQSVADIKSSLFRKFGLVLDKPLIMTEGTAQMTRHLDYYVRSAYEGGWAGYLAWSYYNLVGLNNFQRYSGIVVSKDGRAGSSANIDFYRTFNRDHESTVGIEP
jgi:hypothetical protein